MNDDHVQQKINVLSIRRELTGLETTLAMKELTKVAQNNSGIPPNFCPLSPKIPVPVNRILISEVKAKAQALNNMARMTVT